MNLNSALVGTAGHAPHPAGRLASRHERDDAVVLGLKALGQLGHGGPASARKPLDLQQELVLQRRDAMPVRHLLAEAEELAQLVAKAAMFSKSGFDNFRSDIPGTPLRSIYIMRRYKSCSPDVMGRGALARGAPRASRPTATHETEYPFGPARGIRCDGSAGQRCQLGRAHRRHLAPARSSRLGSEVQQARTLRARKSRVLRRQHRRWTRRTSALVRMHPGPGPKQHETWAGVHSWAPPCGPTSSC